MSNYYSHKVHGNLSKNTYLNTAPPPYIFYQAYARLIAQACAKSFFCVLQVIIDAQSFSNSFEGGFRGCEKI